MRTTGSIPVVVRAGQGLAWHAHDPEGATVGAVKAWTRPDGRCFVLLDSCRADAYEPLLGAVAEDLGRDLHVTVDEADEGARRLYEQLGFAVDRREGSFAIPTDPALTRLRHARMPDGFELVRADEVEEGRLRMLDDALRQDVPGTDGWRWDEADFRAETFDSPFFDPSTYLIAVEGRSGEYAGLVRVWNNPRGPRLGLIAVLAPYRRRGLGRALLARAFGALHERGRPEVSAEVDDANVASRSLLEGLGARRTGGWIELVGRPASSRHDP